VRRCAGVPVRQCASAPVRRCAGAPVRRCDGVRYAKNSFGREHPIVLESLSCVVSLVRS
jgi:hypothetical protein